jgi:hypothetical protein
MPNCDFYATGDDFVRILDFLFEQPGWILIESASRNDQPLRRFGSPSEVLGSVDLAIADAHLWLYAPALGGEVVERKVTYRAGAVAGALGRTLAEGWGLIQLDLAAARDGSIRPSHTGHNSQARAHGWEATYLDRLGPVDAWDWLEVVRTSSRLNRFIRGLAMGKSGSRPILPMAATAVAQGAVLAANA